MNYKKVIKDLKERNDKLQEQYRVRDMRCIHLEYENEMLKSDFKAQHELTKKYAKENKQLKYNWNKLKKYIRKNIIYDDVGMKILDPSLLEDYIQELEQGDEL